MESSGSLNASVELSRTANRTVWGHCTREKCALTLCICRCLSQSSLTLTKSVPGTEGQQSQKPKIQGIWLGKRQSLAVRQQILCRLGDRSGWLFQPVRLKFLDSLSSSFSACKLAYSRLSSSFSYNTSLNAARAANTHSLMLSETHQRKQHGVNSDSNTFPKASSKKERRSFDKQQIKNVASNLNILFRQPQHCCH